MKVGHLCLSRKVDEAVQIGADVLVRVVRIEGGVVRLRISAPRDQQVMREEVLLRLREEVSHGKVA